jgi:hypothetical protein
VFFTQGAGYTACSRLYGRSHSEAVTIWAVWERSSHIVGAGLTSVDDLLISARMRIIALQNRSNSAFDSLSVGSIINVPATGTTP